MKIFGWGSAPAKERKRCQATTRNQHPCRALAVANSRYCFFHDPAKKNQRREAQQRGGEANRGAVLPAATPDVPLKTAKEVAELLASTTNRVLRGEVSPKVGSTVGYLASELRKTLDVGNLEERLARVEAALQTRKSETPLFDPYANGDPADDGNGSDENEAAADDGSGPYENEEAAGREMPSKKGS